MSLEMNQATTKLSIIIPVYNVEKYLGRCLDSLLKQDLDLADYEIIAVNDGSTDASESILQKYAGEYANLKWVTTANQGVSEARNHGCNMAEGEYLLFVDADDYVAPNTLNQIYQTLVRNQLDVLVMDYTYWDDQNKEHLYSDGFRKKQLLPDKVTRGKVFMQR